MDIGVTSSTMVSSLPAMPTSTTISGCSFILISAFECLMWLWLWHTVKHPKSLASYTSGFAISWINNWFSLPAIHVGLEPAKWKKLSNNPICGYIFDTAGDRGNILDFVHEREHVTCQPVLVGQYLIIQNIKNAPQVMGINEVEVGFDLNTTGNDIDSIDKT